jgi:hypothetical protein
MKHTIDEYVKENNLEDAVRLHAHKRMSEEHTKEEKEIADLL